MQVFCFQCKKINEIATSSGQIGRREECQFCKWDLHVCKNCEMYDPQSYNECREPSAEVVREKERANFCDYFKARTSGDVTDHKAKLLSAAEALFKKNS